MKRWMLFIIIMCVFLISGCEELDGTGKNTTGDYVIPVTKEVKCPWGWMDMPTGEFSFKHGDCVVSGYVSIDCPNDNPVPLPGTIILASIGAACVGVIKRKRLI